MFAIEKHDPTWVAGYIKAAKQVRSEDRNTKRFTVVQDIRLGLHEIINMTV